ncbi:MAG: polysaccharide deacetylase family protein [Anaerolineales bacterium]|nr:polysaccharide deacetylase family protein [Anaerolineales bacterium]
MYNKSKTPTYSSRTSIGRKFLDFTHKSGLIRAGRGLFKNSLTVINYHRINEPHHPSFDSFKPNVSATPSMFEEQMQYLQKQFQIISVSDLSLWLEKKKELPPYAALITFDDGYLDNYTYAFPILRKYKFPAVIFLATGHIGTDEPFHWDLAAYSFSHTEKERVFFPNEKNARTWHTKAEALKVCHLWVEGIKLLPDEEKQKWVEQLPTQLDVSIPKNYFKNLMCNWDQVREMNQNGINFGGHTINHPILSRISLEMAQTQIKGSKDRIEEELNTPVLSFAYPNGMKADINKNIEAITKQAGYKVAFTLLNGPSPLSEVKQNPFTIRRIFISHTHTISHYAALTSFFNRYRK